MIDRTQLAEALNKNPRTGDESYLIDLAVAQLLDFPTDAQRRAIVKALFDHESPHDQLAAIVDAVRDTMING